MTLRYRLRTLLIVLALGPPVLAAYRLAIQKWHARQILAEAQERLGRLEDEMSRPGSLAPGMTPDKADRLFDAACAASRSGP